MEKDLLSRVLDFARECEDVRAVTMEGSRVDPDARRDRYSDFDVCFYVRDIRVFTKSGAWAARFGEPVIRQCAENVLKDYDFESREPYIYMMQYADGSRVDLGLKDLSQIEREADFSEPRRVLLDKDGYVQLRDNADNSAYFVRRPTEKDYFDCCNEFRWVSVYVSKGLCRKQLYYAKYHFDVTCMRQLVQMLSWRAAAPHDFRISVGAHAKYLEKYLPAAEFARFAGVFPNGDYADIQKKLYLMYDLFADAARFVARALDFVFDEAESARVRAFLEQREKEMNIEEE